MRVTLLSFGFEEYCTQLAAALAPQARLHLLLPNGSESAAARGLGETVRVEPFVKPKFRQPARQVRMIRELLRTIRRFDPEVLHLQGGHAWFNLALPLLRGYPLVVTVHNPRHHLGDRPSRKTPQWILDFGVRRADQLIVHGRALKQAVVHECRVPGESVHVVGHIEMDGHRGPIPAPRGEERVLFFGRIWEYKGLEYLIRAEPRITAVVPDAKIVIAGEGEDFARYRRMMAHPDRFIVHNEYVSREARAELFRQASVVVLPYIEATQSGVVPIAYSYGKPVVATSVGGLPEAVEHGRTGLLVPPRDERALAEAIVSLLGDKAWNRQLGANGRRKLDAECSPEVVARQTLAVYRRAMVCRAGPRRG